MAKFADLLKILPFVSKLFGLLPLPDWNDLGAARLWCLKAAGLWVEISDTTATTVDDVPADAVLALVNNEAAFAAVYGIVIDLIDGNDDNLTERCQAVAETVNADADPKIDPVTIIAIISAVIELIKLWRERRQAA